MVDSDFERFKRDVRCAVRRFDRYANVERVEHLGRLQKEKRMHEGAAICGGNQTGMTAATWSGQTKNV